jgi:hypothetical protein
MGKADRAVGRIIRRLVPALAFTALAALAVPSPAQSPLSPGICPQWCDAAGQLRWPPDDGCANPAVGETLPPGTTIDRYGSEFGHFFASPGTSYAERSLPYDPTQLPYTVYIVREPLMVTKCTTAPWFGEPGGGVQFKTVEPAVQLKTEGVIEPQ